MAIAIHKEPVVIQEVAVLTQVELGTSKVALVIAPVVSHGMGATATRLHHRVVAAVLTAHGMETIVTPTQMMAVVG